MARLNVEVVYAQRRRQEVVHLVVEEGTRAMQAVRESGLLSAVCVACGDAPLLGIFGKSVTPDTVLCEGDRVEIYRPLTLDPKAARRARAARKPPPSR